MFIYSSRNNSPLAGIGCLAFGILALIGLFYILKGLFTLLWYAAPLLFALALIINWRVVVGVGKNYLRIFRQNPVSGILLGILSIVGFPVLALFLFLSALSGKQAERFFQSPPTQPEEEFTDFEEIESIPNEEEIPPPPPPAQKDDNPYDDLLKP